MMKVLLGLWDYEVTLAHTATDGFRWQQSERFDWCLLDTSLPLDGRCVSSLSARAHFLQFKVYSHSTLLLLGYLGT